MLDITEIKYRKAPSKYTKVQSEGERSNITNRKMTKLYDYYICDYCKAEIRLDKKARRAKRRDSSFTTFFDKMWTNYSSLML